MILFKGDKKRQPQSTQNFEVVFKNIDKCSILVFRWKKYHRLQPVDVITG
jgi:hypothetical protein